MASTGRVIGIGFLAVAVAGGGGYYLYSRSQQKDQNRIGQSFADLSQCLAGKLVATDGEIVLEISTLEGRLAHRPAELRTLGDGSKWPSTCAPHARAIYDIVHASSSYERDAKGKLLAELDALEKAAAAEDPAGAALPGKAASLWRVMQENGIAMAKQSSSPTPPSIQRSDVQGDLPFAQLLPLDGGPVPQFLIEMPRKKDPNAPDAGAPDTWGREPPDPEGRVSLCAFADGTLTCKKIPGPEVYTPVGRWASTAFVPLGVDGELGLFDGTKVTRLGIQAPLAHDVFVDGKGTVFALDCTGPRGRCLIDSATLLVKPVDGAAKRKDLVTVLEPIKDDVSSTDVVLYRDALYFAGRPAARAPLSAEGKIASGSIQKLGVDLDFVPRQTCVSDGTIVAYQGKGQIFFTDKSAIVAPGGPLLRCYPGGYASTSDLEICNAEGCKLAIPEDMKKRLPDNAVVGRVGDRNALLWSAKGAKGVLLQFLGADPKKLEPEIVLAEKSVDRQFLAIIGTKDGALVFWEHDKAPRGVFVAPDGKVAPIKISM